MAVLQSISISQLQNQLLSQPFPSPLRRDSLRRIPTLRKTTCQSADTCEETRITAATPAELEPNTAPPVSPIHLSPILRRQACIAAWSSAVTAFSGGFDASWGVQAAHAAATVSVGSYLPSAGVGNLVLFKPDQKATPALRAGKPLSSPVENTKTQNDFGNASHLSPYTLLSAFDRLLHSTAVSARGKRLRYIRCRDLNLNFHILCRGRPRSQFLYV